MSIGVVLCNVLLIAVEFAINLTGGLVFLLLFSKAILIEYLPSLIIFIPCLIMHKKLKEYIWNKEEPQKYFLVI